MKALFLCDDTKVKEIAELCIGSGFGIEVQSFYDPSYEAENPDAVSLHEQLIAPISMRSLHGPFGDLFAGSFDPMVRDLARFRFEHAVSIALQLDIHRIILHHGYVPGTTPPTAWISRCTRFWTDFLNDKPQTIQIHLENHLEQSPDMLLELLSTVGDPRLSACIDIGHVHCCAKADIVAWIAQMKEAIGYVHLHDNHGLKDEHLGLGDGTIPLVEVLNALQEYSPDAIWALESIPDRLPSSLEWLAKHGYN
jgi:sugar phosphate isomerase/epimerase